MVFEPETIRHPKILSRKTAFAAKVALSLIVLAASGTYAQVGVRGVKGISNLGSQAGFGVSKFRAYSTGTDSKNIKSTSSNNYKSSNSRNMQYSGRKSAASTPSSGLAGRKIPNNSSKSNISTLTNYGNSSFKISGPGKARILIDPIATGLLALGTSMETMFGLGDSMLRTDRAVTTFAPDNQGQYATAMRNGEQAMEIRQYMKALDIFQQCDYLNNKLPDSTLALAHANLALGRYSMMAHNLSLAIQRNADIFSANIALRSFFGQTSEFINHRDRLSLHCENFPDDTAALIAKSYVMWFDADRRAAKLAIEQAQKSNSNPLLSSAISDLRNSMYRAENKAAIKSNTPNKPTYSGGALTGMAISVSGDKKIQ